jgi:hypothetical protein
MGLKFLQDIVNLDNIQFVNGSGTNAGLINMDGNDFVLSNPLGDILLGDGSADVFIGDGVNNVDIRFEQSGSITADNASATLTIGGTGGLVIESPTINSPTLNSTSINNKLTFTTANGYINFDYEPSGDAGQYTTPTKLLTVSNGAEEEVIMQRLSQSGALMIGHDDIVAIAAGDTWSILRDNIGWTGENVILSSEAGFTSYAFPNNDTAWSNRNTFRFYGGDATAGNNGLYIGDGGSTQFIDLDRNLKNIGTITATGDFNLTNGFYLAHNDGIRIGETGDASTSWTTLTSFTNGGNSAMKIKGGNYIHHTQFETTWNDFLYARIVSSYNGTDSSFSLYKSDGSGNTAATTTISTGASSFAGSVTAGGNIATSSNSYIVSSRKFTARDANGTGLFADDAASGLSIADDGDATFTGDVTLSGTAPTLRIQDSRNLNNPDWDSVSLGNIEFYTSDTTSPGARVLAEIEAFSNNAAASGPNADLIFKTSAIADSSPQTRLTIGYDGTSTFAGNVTAGSNSLTAGSLDINGDADISGNLTGVDILTATTLRGNHPDGNGLSLRLGRDDNSNYWEFNHAGNDLRIYNSASSGSHILLGVNASGTAQANNVGIGTATPAVKLDVAGDAQLQGAAPRLVMKETGTSKDFSLKVQTDGRFSVLNDNLGSEVLAIKQDGNVGIGTTSPGAKLEVTDGNVLIRPNAAGAALTWRESDNGNIGGQLRSYGNRGDIYLYRDGVKTTEISSLDDSFIPRLHVGGTNQASEALQVTGSIAVSGTVDGRDIATDGTKLDTVATNADVTPSWVPSSDPSYLTAHPNISAASSVNNSGKTHIQDITVDSNGHVTGIVSHALNSSDFVEPNSNATLNSLSCGTFTHPTDISFVLDNDNNETASFTIKDGAGNSPFTLTEAGDLTITGKFVSTYAAKASSGDILVEDSGEIKKRTPAELKTDLSLNNVPNTDATNASNLASGTVPTARLATTTIAKGGTGATSASDARTALGVDAAGTDNSTDVTLAGSLNYITISGQEITRNAIDLAADVTGTLPQTNLPDDMDSDKVKQICTTHHNFFMNSSSTTADFFVPFNNLNESSNPTNAQYYNRMVAPYNGRIVKVVLHTTAAIGTACQVLFWVATSAGVFAPSAAETVTGVNLNTANSSATATFSTNSTAQFSAEDVLGVSIIKSSSSTANMQVTVVWEYTL